MLNSLVLLRFSLLLACKLVLGRHSVAVIVVGGGGSGGAAAIIVLHFVHVTHA